MVQERQEPAEVGLLLDAGHKMPAGSLARPREIFFKKCAGGIDNRFALGMEARRVGRVYLKTESPWVAYCEMVYK